MSHIGITFAGQMRVRINCSARTHSLSHSLPHSKPLSSKSSVRSRKAAEMLLACVLLLLCNRTNSGCSYLTLLAQSSSTALFVGEDVYFCYFIFGYVFFFFQISAILQRFLFLEYPSFSSPLYLFFSFAHAHYSLLLAFFSHILPCA